ncbi:hypothetical protein [Bradyrhizobium yuanmingense]|uniref:hypothetical protein n=1 Tax=Bradyrhizobium yuanmingense TaxID=108015 RepID=UPI0023B9543D|nr:hypothetical protein [Bradyrhizobium yuanmingense]MDF0498632.1 hypothetical protein [Bradyrhizobium yuanmingense]
MPAAAETNFPNLGASNWDRQVGAKQLPLFNDRGAIAGCFSLPTSGAEFRLDQRLFERISPEGADYSSGMTLHSSRSLGILTLERGVPAGAKPPTPPPGSMLNSATFNFPTISETVPGAWVENVVRGDPALEPSFVAAAQRLVQRGAIVISSTCGFSIRHQPTLAAAVNVPVVTSSLLLLPTLLHQLPSAAKIAVLTYDSTHCGEDLLGVDDQAQRARIVIGGIEGGKFWHDELKRPAPPVDVAAIEADVTACVVRLRAAHPEIAAILLECAGFPMVALAVRRMAKLPVYDITDLCRMAMASVS